MSNSNCQFTFISQLLNSSTLKHVAIVVSITCLHEVWKNVIKNSDGSLLKRRLRRPTELSSFRLTRWLRNVHVLFAEQYYILFLLYYFDYILFLHDIILQQNTTEAYFILSNYLKFFVNDIRLILIIKKKSKIFVEVDRRPTKQSTC